MITIYNIEGYKGGFIIYWIQEGFGFGTICFFFKDGKLMCDNETLPKEWLRELMISLVEQAELLD